MGSKEHFAYLAMLILYIICAGIMSKLRINRQTVTSFSQVIQTVTCTNSYCNSPSSAAAVTNDCLV